MARHCFIVNEQGEAIDPTLFTHTKERKDEEDYRSFCLIDNMYEYVDLISENDANPDLLFSLREKEQEIFEWARTNNKILIGQ